jgi:anti-sigma28 factor (negative regulator of flagellin synthesis)
MNEFYLDTTSGKHLTPKRMEREQDLSAKKVTENQPAQKVSFQEVLKGVVDKTEASPKIRQDMVNKYKASLANGTYEVKAQELAEKMIQKIREDKTRKII